MHCMLSTSIEVSRDVHWSFPASHESAAAWLQVRFMARSFGVSGDHPGQQSNGYRWPFGPVALITPFNFPLEIGALQLMGALFMGNKPLVHVDHRCQPPCCAV